MLDLLMKVIRARAMVRAFNRREEKGFTYLFNSCYYGLYHFAFTLLKDKKRSEAVVEKTFITLWKSKGKWKSISAIKLGLYRVAQNLCFAHLKREKKYDRKVRQRIFLHEFIRSETYNTIRTSLDYLPQECHDIFKLRFVQQMEIDEVGNKLGMPRTKVKKGEAFIIQMIKIQPRY